MKASIENENNNTISLKDFITEYGSVIKEKVKNLLTPVFQKTKLDEWDKEQIKKLSKLSRKPFQAQAETIIAITKGFYRADKKSSILVGEMGSGKTLMGVGIATLIPKKNCRVVIICPNHLAAKWAREIKTTDRYCSGVKILNSISDVIFSKPNGREYWIIPKEKSKLHYAEKTVYHTSKKSSALCCPTCWEPLKEDEVVCAHCGSKFTTVDRSKFRRYAIAEYIKRHKKFCNIELLIADEVHELKGGDTAQGQAFHALCVSSNKVLALTGTLMGGYASNLYFLLFRLFTRQLINRGYKHNSSSQFSREYGVVEETIESVTANDRTASLGKVKQIKRIKEKPGVSPLLLPHFLLENSVYLWIADIADELPKYNETIELVPMTDEQTFAYQMFQSELVREVQTALTRHDMRLLGALVNSLFALPDGARRGEIVYDPSYKDDAVALCTAAPINIMTLPKEERLQELVMEEKRNGRKVAIFLEHTGTRDLIPDIVERLDLCNISSLVLRSDTVTTLKREEWLMKNIKDKNPDVLICNPNLVKTGLDLLDFPTIIYFQAGFNIYTLRQSSRRSWRIGQNKDVKVIYMAYENTAQERALKLIATKLETSNAVEGKLSADGLSAMSSGDSSLMYAIARELVDNKNSGGKSLSNIWSDYKKSETVKEELLSESDIDGSNLFAELLQSTQEIPATESQKTHNTNIADITKIAVTNLNTATRQLTIEDFLSAITSD